MDGGFLSQLRERIPFILSVAASTAWLIVLWFYSEQQGWQAVIALPPQELAVLVAAAAGPLMALWLFVAVLEHRRDLNGMAKRMAEINAQARQTLQQAEAQTRTLVQLQASAQQAQAADTRRLVLQDLASQAAILSVRLGVLRREDVDVAWARFGSGDVAAFVQPFLAHVHTHPDMAERMAEALVRDASARGALAAYARRFASLRAALSGDKLALEVLEEGPLGRAFRLFAAADSLLAAREAKAQPSMLQAADPAAE